MAAPPSSNPSATRADPPGDGDLGAAVLLPEVAEADSFDALSFDPLSAPIRSARPGARIWILDADRIGALQLQRIVEACGWQCLLMHSVRELDAFLTEVAPDVLVAEQQWPDTSGCQVVQRLRGAGHRFPVLLLSAQAAPLDRIRGLEAGAHDYLAKPCAERELMLRLERLLLSGSAAAVVLEAGATRYAIAGLPFDPAGLSLGSGAEPVRLSRGEAALLLQFCQAPGLILSREQLARGSGSIVDVGNSRSLDMRISKLRRLLERMQAGLGERLETVRGRGYRLSAEIRRIGA
jgi:DNA-binding response OmpR family regulator